MCPRADNKSNKRPLRSPPSDVLFGVRVFAIGRPRWGGEVCIYGCTCAWWWGVRDKHRRVFSPTRLSCLSGLPPSLGYGRHWSILEHQSAPPPRMSIQRTDPAPKVPARTERVCALAGVRLGTRKSAGLALCALAHKVPHCSTRFYFAHLGQLPPPKKPRWGAWCCHRAGRT